MPWSSIETVDVGPQMEATHNGFFLPFIAAHDRSRLLLCSKTFLRNKQFKVLRVSGLFCADGSRAVGHKRFLDSLRSSPDMRKILSFSFAALLVIALCAFSAMAQS